MLEAAQLSSRKVHAEHEYVRFKDVRDAHGEIAAKLIRDDKRQLQRDLESKNPKEAIRVPWCMRHPDMPGNEDYKSSTILYYTILYYKYYYYYYNYKGPSCN